MPKATKVCKICGKTYPYCRSQRTVEGVFRWQDVACCPEHGSEYLTAVKISRGEIDVVAPAEEAVPVKTSRKSAKTKPAEAIDTVNPAEQEAMTTEK